MTGASARPDVTAVVVSWNTRDLLADCLRSLRAHAPAGRTLEVIVVDNGSRDGTGEMVRRGWPEARLIANPENLGYTRANNQAIRASRGRYLLLINADARLTPDCLRRLLQRIDADPRAGAVGPRLVYGDGSWQRWTAGRAPSLRTAVNYFLFLERLLPGNPAFAGIFLGRDVRASCRVDWVSSACMLVRRSALDEVGLLDERFFVYMDDVDLCRRLRDAGWRVWYCPEAEAIHLGGQSTLRQTGSVSPEALRSFNRYFALRHGARAAALLRVAEALGFALRTLAYLVAAAVRGGEPRLRAKARAHWTYCKVSIEPRGPSDGQQAAGQALPT